MRSKFTRLLAVSLSVVLGVSVATVPAGAGEAVKYSVGAPTISEEGFSEASLVSGKFEPLRLSAKYPGGIPETEIMLVKDDGSKVSTTDYYRDKFPVFLDLGIRAFNQKDKDGKVVTYPAFCISLPGENQDTVATVGRVDNPKLVNLMSSLPYSKDNASQIDWAALAKKYSSVRLDSSSQKDMQLAIQFAVYSAVDERFSLSLVDAPATLKGGSDYFVDGQKKVLMFGPLYKAEGKVNPVSSMDIYTTWPFSGSSSLAWPMHKDDAGEISGQLTAYRNAENLNQGVTVDFKDEWQGTGVGQILRPNVFDKEAEAYKLYLELVKEFDQPQPGHGLQENPVEITFKDVTLHRTENQDVFIKVEHDSLPEGVSAEITVKGLTNNTFKLNNGQGTLVNKEDVVAKSLDEVSVVISATRKQSGMAIITPANPDSKTQAVVTPMVVKRDVTVSRKISFEEPKTPTPETSTSTPATKTPDTSTPATKPTEPTKERSPSVTTTTRTVTETSTVTETTTVTTPVTQPVETTTVTAEPSPVTKTTTVTKEKPVTVTETVEKETTVTSVKPTVSTVTEIVEPAPVTTVVTSTVQVPQDAVTSTATATVTTTVQGTPVTVTATETKEAEKPVTTTVIKEPEPQPLTPEEPATPATPEQPKDNAPNASPEEPAQPAASTTTTPAHPATVEENKKPSWLIPALLLLGALIAIPVVAKLLQPKPAPAPAPAPQPFSNEPAAAPATVQRQKLAATGADGIEAVPMV